MTLHMYYRGKDGNGKERYNNNKNKKEEPEYENGDKSFFKDVIGYTPVCLQSNVKKR